MIFFTFVLVVICSHDVAFRDRRISACFACVIVNAGVKRGVRKQNADGDLLSEGSLNAAPVGPCVSSRSGASVCFGSFTGRLTDRSGRRSHGFSVSPHFNYYRRHIFVIVNVINVVLSVLTAAILSFMHPLSDKESNFSQFSKPTGEHIK